MKRLLLSLIVVLLGVFIFAGCAQPAPAPAPAPAPKPAPAPAPAPKPVTWTVTSMSKPKHLTTLTFIEMGKLISERTNGQLKFDVHTIEEYGYKGPEMLSLYREGAFVIGEVMGNYHEGEDPELAIDGLPFLGTTKDYAAKLKALRPYFEQALNRHNLKALAVYSYPSMLWETKEIKTLDDFKGRKIRVTATAPANALRALGASALPMEASEIYQALSTGILTGTTFSVTGGKPFGFQEVAKFLYLSPPISGMASAMVVNKKAFDSLPANVQKVLVDTGKEFEPKLVDGLVLVPPGLRKELEAKMKVFDSLDPPLVDQMIKIGAMPEWDRWIAAHPKAKPAMDAIMSALGIKR